MRKIWVVMRREFVEKVRNKWFVVSTILGPILMGALIVVPILLAERGGTRRDVVVLDVTTSDFGARVVDRLNGPPPVDATRLKVSLDQIEAVADSLVAEVGEKNIDGFLILTDATVDDGVAEYRGSNVASLSDISVLQRVVRETVLIERLNRVGVDPTLVSQATIPVSLETVRIRGGETTEDSGEAAFFLAYAMWFLLYMMILLYGVQVLGSVVEEKTTRIVEVLVSSLRPFELLAGKIGGVGAVGLFQMLIWIASARFLLGQQGRIAGLLGVELGVDGLRLPEVPASTVILFLTFFLLGYFLYAAMFAAAAAMSNSEAEARQAQTPVVMLLIVPTVMMLSIIQQPDGGAAVALSLIPFTSPIAMPVRWAAAEVPIVEVVASVIFLGLGLIVVTWIAGRIYRIGILMHGKRPNLKQLVRWVRTR